MNHFPPPEGDGFSIGLSDRLASIAAQMASPDPTQSQPAIDELQTILQTLPEFVLSADDALTLQALALSALEYLPGHLDDPQRAIGLIWTVARAVRGAASFNEMLTGTSIMDRAFFSGDGSPRLQ